MVCVGALWSRWRGQRNCYTQALSTLSGPGQRNQAGTRGKGAGTQMTAEVTANFWASSVDVFEHSHLHLMCYSPRRHAIVFSLVII